MHTLFCVFYHTAAKINIMHALIGVLLYSKVFPLLSNHTLLRFVTSGWCSLEGNMQLIRACGWYMSLPKDPLHVALGFWHWLFKNPWSWTPSAYSTETPPHFTPGYCGPCFISFENFWMSHFSMTRENVLVWTLSASEDKTLATPLP